MTGTGTDRSTNGRAGGVVAPVVEHDRYETDTFAEADGEWHDSETRSTDAGFVGMITDGSDASDAHRQGRLRVLDWRNPRIGRHVKELTELCSAQYADRVEPSAITGLLVSRRGRVLMDEALSDFPINWSEKIDDAFGQLLEEDPRPTHLLCEAARRFLPDGCFSPRFLKLWSADANEAYHRGQEMVFPDVKAPRSSQTDLLGFNLDDPTVCRMLLAQHILVERSRTCLSGRSYGSRKHELADHIQWNVISAEEIEAICRSVEPRVPEQGFWSWILRLSRTLPHEIPPLHDLWECSFVMMYLLQRFAVFHSRVIDREVSQQPVGQLLPGVTEQRALCVRVKRMAWEWMFAGTMPIEMLPAREAGLRWYLFQPPVGSTHQQALLPAAARWHAAPEFNLLTDSTQAAPAQQEVLPVGEAPVSVEQDFQ